jgi:hypothetical protein
MTPTCFFRLVNEAEKGDRLSEAVAAVRDGKAVPGIVHSVDPASFRQIPGAPFAYWVSNRIRRLFRDLPAFEANGRQALRGAFTGDDFRRVRAWWEVRPETLRHFGRRSERGLGWAPFAKGGVYSPFYSDVHLVVAWDFERNTFVAFYGRPGREIERPEACDHFFRPGLTWPLRTQSGLSTRALPAGCVFGHKGPSAFAPRDDAPTLLALIAASNSRAFRTLVDLQMTFGSFEVGVIERTPLPDLASEGGERLGPLARLCLDLKRGLDTANETSHVFHAPALLQVTEGILTLRLAAWHARVAEANRRLAEHQCGIDDIAYRLYGIDAGDRRAIEQSSQATDVAEGAQEEGAALPDQDDEQEDEGPSADTRGLVADLISYAVGCALGRWDVRVGTGERPVPELPGPFDPLPVSSPGMLTGADGLPLREAPPDYPLRIDPDGILVDDPGPDGKSPHQDDILRRVREVLGLLWGERAEAIEKEACGILEVEDLREYFRNPKGFFEDHIKRYSKSRRKAPIYWLLQSGKRSFGLWLYYHRLDKDTLFKAIQHYVEPKIRGEMARLRELTAQLEGGIDRLPRREVTQLEKAIDRQQDLLTELTAFRDALQRVADIGYDPDLDDGVVLNIAPLHQVVPWKEAKKYWDDLCAGKYAWSTMAQRLRAKGLVAAGAPL